MGEEVVEVLDLCLQASLRPEVIDGDEALLVLIELRDQGSESEILLDGEPHPEQVKELIQRIELLDDSHGGIHRVGCQGKVDFSLSIGFASHPSRLPLQA